MVPPPVEWLTPATLFTHADPDHIAVLAITRAQKRLRRKPTLFVSPFAQLATRITNQGNNITKPEQQIPCSTTVFYQAALVPSVDTLHRQSDPVQFSYVSCRLARGYQQLAAPLYVPRSHHARIYRGGAARARVYRVRVAYHARRAAIAVAQVYPYRRAVHSNKPLVYYARHVYQGRRVRDEPDGVPNHPSRNLFGIAAYPVIARLPRHRAVAGNLSRPPAQRVSEIRCYLACPAVEEEWMLG